ncbi:ATP-binding protein [Streptomyces sp. b84]|uniref:ATP-binding protein n=1 Tax=Streptomyces sp. b84 TaxID=1827631 RepID=UPI0015CF62A1|nr:ATP-binding protein [Streptomyces sp. b84]
MPYRTPDSKSASLLVSSEVAAVSDARRQIVAMVRQWGWPIAPDAVDTLELLAGEVIANAVVHTGSGCHVTVSWNGACLRVEVKDPGPALVLRPAAVSSDAECGRGLQLVECLAARWGSLPTLTGKAVWFEIDGRVPPSSRTPSEPHDEKPDRPALPRTAPAVRGGGGRARLIPQIT